MSQAFLVCMDTHSGLTTPFGRGSEARDRCLQQLTEPRPQGAVLNTRSDELRLTQLEKEAGFYFAECGSQCEGARRKTRRSNAREPVDFGLGPNPEPLAEVEA